MLIYRTFTENHQVFLQKNFNLRLNLTDSFLKLEEPAIYASLSSSLEEKMNIKLMMMMSNVLSIKNGDGLMGMGYPASIAPMFF